VDDSEAQAEKVPVRLFSFVFFGGSIDNTEDWKPFDDESMMRPSVVNLVTQED